MIIVEQHNALQCLGCLFRTERAIYPPALAAVLPEVKHIRGKLPQQRIERDYQHLKGVRP